MANSLNSQSSDPPVLCGQRPVLLQVSKLPDGCIYVRKIPETRENRVIWNVTTSQTHRNEESYNADTQNDPDDTKQNYEYLQLPVDSADDTGKRINSGAQIRKKIYQLVDVDEAFVTKYQSLLHFSLIVKRTKQPVRVWCFVVGTQILKEIQQNVKIKSAVTSEVYYCVKRHYHRQRYEEKRRSVQPWEPVSPVVRKVFLEDCKSEKDILVIFDW